MAKNKKEDVIPDVSEEKIVKETPKSVDTSNTVAPEAPSGFYVISEGKDYFVCKGGKKVSGGMVESKARDIAARYNK